LTSETRHFSELLKKNLSYSDCAKAYMFLKKELLWMIRTPKRTQQKRTPISTPVIREAQLDGAPALLLPRRNTGGSVLPQIFFI
jgi:hypothetical protein